MKTRTLHQYRLASGIENKPKIVGPYRKHILHNIRAVDVVPILLSFSLVRYLLLPNSLVNNLTDLGSTEVLPPPRHTEIETEMVLL